MLFWFESVKRNRTNTTAKTWNWFKHSVFCVENTRESIWRTNNLRMQIDGLIISKGSIECFKQWIATMFKETSFILFSILNYNFQTVFFLFIFKQKKICCCFYSLYINLYKYLKQFHELNPYSGFFSVCTK